MSSGSAGGLAECAPDRVAKYITDCGWVSGTVALVMEFSRFSHDEAKALVPKILDAMVTS